MYKSIEKGLTLSHSFASSCQKLEQELIHLSKKNKKEFLVCFNAASFALGHDVPLSFAPMLIPSIDRVICSWVKYNGGIGFNDTQVFDRRNYQQLSTWKRVCVCVAQKKNLRKRTDGRFGSEKVTKKPRKIIKSDIKIGLFKKISEIKFSHENMNTTLLRISNIFRSSSDCIVTDLIVKLICPFSLTRMNVPGRTIECKHITCFDLENFAKLAETQSNFELSCPECKSKKKWKTNQLIVDPLFEEILDNTTPDTKKARLYKDGKWEAIKETEKEEVESEDESRELLLSALLDINNNESDKTIQRNIIDLT